MKKTSSIAKATGTVGGVTIISRVLGMLRDMLIAGHFGAGLVSDAFFLAFTIPNLLRRLVAEGSLATAFVPIFSENIEEGEQQAKRAFKEVGCFSLLLTTVLTVLGIYFAVFLTRVFAPGFGENPRQLALSVSLTKVMMPYVIIISLVALTSAALNTLGRFALPAAAPAILNVSMITSILLFSPTIEEPIYALAIAVPIGGIAGLIPLLFQLKQLGYTLSPANPFKSTPVRKVGLLMVPSIFSSSVYQLMVLVNRMLASMLALGSISWYYFADRLVQFPLGVFSIALATAILPELSRLAAKNDNQGFREQLLSGMRWVSFITLPASIGLIALAEPIVSAIYAYGRFGAGDVENTARALKAFSIGLWPISAHALVVRAFLAKKNTLIPSLVSVISIVVNIGLAIALMGAPSSVPDSSLARLIADTQSIIGVASLQHVGLALAGSLSSFLSFALLTVFLRQVSVSFPWKEFLLASAKCFLACLAMYCALSFTSFSKINPVLAILLGVPIGAASYALAALLLQISEARVSWGQIKKLALNSTGN